VKSKLPAIEGRRLTTELTVHNNDFGGVTAVVYGSKGSGKTTLFLTLAQTVQCYNPSNGNLEFETSIWRGGDEDYWTWLPYNRTRVFIHRDNIDTVSFKCDEDLLEYDRSNCI
jgi:ABC-type oligopeptide transport system ATPase subunit